MKEIVFRIDEETLDTFKEDLNRKRTQATSTSLCDNLLIRFFSALDNNTKVLLFKKQDKKISVKTSNIV